MNGCLISMKERCQIGRPEAVPCPFLRLAQTISGQQKSTFMQCRVHAAGVLARGGGKESSPASFRGLDSQVTQSVRALG